MAKIKFGAIVTDMRGKVGSHVFSKNKSGAYARSFKTNVVSNTDSQQVVRQRLAMFSTQWSSLTQSQRDNWNSSVAAFKHTNVFGNVINPSGFDLYVKLNCNLDQIGIAPLTVPPVPGLVQNVSSLSLMSNEDSAVFEVTFDRSAISDDIVLVLNATSSISPGKNYVKNLLRQIHVLTDDNVSPYDAYAAYTAKFGVPQANARVSISMVGVNAITGQKSAPLNATAIVQGLNPATVALLAAMVVQPSTPEIIAINEMIVSLIDTGIFAKLDYLHVYAQETSQAALLNWVAPSDFTGSLVNAPTFTSDRGFAGDGLTSYIDTNFNPSADGVNFTLNKAAHGVYVRTDPGVGAYAEIGAEDAGGDFTSIHVRFSDGNNYVLVNNNAGGNVNFANASALGFFTGRRSASNILASNKNGVQQAANATVSTALPNLNMWVCGVDNNGVLLRPSPRQLALSYAGSSDIDDAVFYSIIQTYMSAVGANV